MRADSQFTTAIHICIFIHFKERSNISSQTIAESVKTNPVVIRRLISKLRNHGIIKSNVGSGGGFSLNKPADQITLWNIYLAVREKQFFRKPPPNPDCKVSSNLAALVDDTFLQSELAMQAPLAKVNIAELTDQLRGILQEQDPTFC
jgi:Rrf2 family protein